MPKLTTTASALLKQARESRHGLITVHTGYFIGRRTPSYGARKHAAAIALRDAGLVTFHSRNSGVHHFIGNRSADHYTEHTFAITEAGRAFA